MFQLKHILKKTAVFLLGAACFIISQPLLRLPILQSLQKSTDFALLCTLNPLPAGIIIAFSASVFEEGFRFLFKRFLLRPDRCGISQPIIFGLGHGIAEAVMILAPALAAFPVSQLGLAFLERGLAVILHVALTVIVWNGFQRKRKILCLLTAIGIHGFVNSLIPLLTLTPLPDYVLLLEGAFAVIDILLVVYIFYSKRYYLGKG